MEIVSFELAKKLKEKGFSIPFYFYYRTDEKPLLHHANTTNPLVYCDKVDDEVVIAPTISQALKWLREEKKLYIEIYMRHNCYLWEIYNTKIYDDVDFDQKSEKYSELEYKTYEQAAIAGIEYLINNNLI